MARACCVLLLVLAPAARATALPAQCVVPPLDERALLLTGGQGRAYRVELKRGDALLGTVEQRGIDVVVGIRDPRGTLVLEIDSPNGTAGPEPIAFVAKVPGLHVVEVRALEPEAPEGRYDVRLERVRPGAGGRSGRAAPPS